MPAMSTVTAPIPSIRRPGDQPGRLRRALAVAAAAVFLPLLTLPGCAPTVSRGGPVEPEGDRAALDRFLAGQRDALGLPGMAVAVVRGRDVIYVQGFGSDGRGRPVDGSTQFMLASLSKSFTAAAVLQLVRAGRIDLDAPVRDYLPEFTTADPSASRRITVRHLLNHTSGLSDAGFRAGLSAQPRGLEQRVDDLRAAWPVSAPGREFHYFEPNYQLLARLVEVTTGQDFDRYLARQVFGPLGMTATVAVDTTPEAGLRAPRLAEGHVLVFGVPVARRELDGLLTGSSGVISTAPDMARWLALHLTDGRAGWSLPGLEPADYALMHAPPPDVASTYGQGWQVVTPADGPQRIEHTGVLSTFSADQVLLPDSGYGFVVLYNGNSALADTAGLKAALATYLSGRGSATSARSSWTIALVFLGLSLATLTAAVRSLVRRSVEADRAVRGRRWRVFGRAVWLLAPVAVLVGLPWLILAVADRWFTRWQFSLAMPDVTIFLLVAAVSGAVVNAARLRR